MDNVEGAEVTPKFQLVESNPKNLRVPSIPKDELDAICDLQYDQDSLNLRILLTNSKRVSPILYSLAARNFGKELPIREETFRYKRNFMECERLKPAVHRLLDKGLKGKIDWDVDADLIDQVEELLILEKRKADWLERRYFPVIYKKASDQARGDVSQFLLRQANTAGIEKFPNWDEIPVHFLDELNYLLNSYDPETVGGYDGRSIVVRVPDYYGISDEWKIYHVLVHEFVHAASIQNERKIGIQHHYRDPDYKEINEAITELITFSIASEHLTRNKKTLKGVSKSKITISDLAYQGYIVVMNHILQKIPIEAFIYAMFNEDGFKLLKEKFAKEKGSKKALLEFGKNIKRMFKKSNQE